MTRQGRAENTQKVDYIKVAGKRRRDTPGDGLVVVGRLSYLGQSEGFAVRRGRSSVSE